MIFWLYIGYSVVLLFLWLFFKIAVIKDKRLNNDRVIQKIMKWWDWMVLVWFVIVIASSIYEWHKIC